MSDYAYCPHCDSRVVFGKRPVKGQRVRCRECGTELEVVRLNPLEVDWADEEMERDEDEQSNRPKWSFWGDDARVT